MTHPTLWTKPSCVQCNAVKRFLKESDIPFIEASLVDPDHQEKLDGFKAAGILSAPVTEWGDFTIPGFDVGQLESLRAAYREEELRIAS